jgi:catechol 2,3-dioxygenase-like lactoylglutathione lyase family enzyme
MRCSSVPPSSPCGGKAVAEGVCQSQGDRVKDVVVGRDTDRDYPLARTTGERDMKVNRIVANVETQTPAAAKRFYQDVLGLDVLMDLGWIATYGSRQKMSVQISFLSQGGSDTPTPDLSIEVDDVDDALERMRAAGFPIEYGPADEPWGVRRFYVRDPFGKLVNILAHARATGLTA